MKPFLQNYRLLKHRLLLVLAMLLATSSPMLAHAAKLNFLAVDKNGNPMPDVVVYATPTGMPLPATEKTEATIAQSDMQFSPYVTAIRTGSQVKFPNYDKMEHHVKSFSAVKEFEIKTYERGVVPPPVIFDKPGIVIVYCLLHNWMRAYVLVLDTPYFVKTDQNGVAMLDKLPDGNYELKAWHPNLGSIKPALSQSIKVNDQSAPVKWQFDFVPVPRKSKSPG
ncbi:methylamine utilization protein [Undibacterium pigrum]|uniref:Plastocyanin n=1 Tax=Undibacterium pigrum TaxID=401470 RepID=A0A318JE42_9BURK|nr:methylamine utilization protein [Undibacterium pigrum]PXX45364.1 plastocyanin [Undibacterium pigrum]